MSRSLVKTVSFYEVVRGKDDYSPRMDEVPWQQALEVVSFKPGNERTFTTPEGERFIGEAVFAADSLHLIVGRIGAGYHQTVDLDQGHIEDLRLDGNKGFIDTTTVCFLEFGNIIGVLHGSQSSPRASSIQRWMNACGFTTDDIALWPVISQDVWLKLKNASAVHNFEFSFRPNPAFMPPIDTSIFGFTRDAGERYQDHRLTFKIEVPKRGPGGVTSRARGQRRLQEDAMHFVAELGQLGGLERARALVTTSTEEGYLKDEPLDFLKHHVTAKKRVEVRSEDSRPRYAASVEAILEAAREHTSDLKAAVSARH
ncbi:hypothetical protein ACWDNT_10535 [Streptomyces sp. NPDC000963]